MIHTSWFKCRPPCCLLSLGFIKGYAGLDSILASMYQSRSYVSLLLGVGS